MRADLSSSAPPRLPTQSGGSSGKCAQMCQRPGQLFSSALQPLLALWSWLTASHWRFASIGSVGSLCEVFVFALFAVSGVRGLGLKKYNLCVGLEEREGSGSRSWSYRQGKDFLPTRSPSWVSVLTASVSWKCRMKHLRDRYINKLSLMDCGLYRAWEGARLMKRNFVATLKMKLRQLLFF